MALLGAVALGTVALKRGENINAVWLVIAAVCTYLIAYRFYGLFIARAVVEMAMVMEAEMRSRRSAVRDMIRTFGRLKTKSRAP